MPIAESSVFESGQTGSYEAAAPDEEGKPRWFSNHVGLGKGATLVIRLPIVRRRE